MNHDKILINGAWRAGEGSFPVRNKYTGAIMAQVGTASRQQVTDAVRVAAAAVERGAPSPYQRYVILSRAAELLERRRRAVIETIVGETGFTVSDARGELARSIETLRISAEEARRLKGEMVPLAGAPGQDHRIGFTIRVPVGVVCAITPYNAPLNTVAHKIAPALAAGNSVVLKPSAYTPMTAALLCEVLLEAGLPPDLLALLHGEGSTVGRWLLENQAIKFYTFTGSTAVGRAIQQAAGLRRTQLELGSIASTIICEDADLDRALPKIVNACFRKAGQVCTSIQRLYVDRRVEPVVVERLLQLVAALKVGDPMDEETHVGPMIAVGEAERAERWVREAVEQGAVLRAGGRRDGALLYPTVLTSVRAGMKVVDQEIFAPVVSVIPYDDIADALSQVNNTPYGLATGIFTNSLAAAFSAARTLSVGSVHVNETCSSRVDLMPYGGVKDSGFGKEGPRYAMQEMTEERLITFSL